MIALQDLTIWKTAVLLAYFAVLAILSFYGAHRYGIVRLYRKYAQGADPAPKQTYPEEKLPRVTVQLPLFNERYVVERLIDAACKLDYPAHLLEIQVLDDSTDDTTALARERVQFWQKQGIDITLLHRKKRQGFKAGALQDGLKSARGEFVAIFDADFIPQPDFLRQTVHHFTDPEIGMVQARWEYINRDFSLLTRAQAVLLDGHFILEHTARNRSERFFNFNGTAGIWRRKTIDDAGGWKARTLTEDLDLSYRAQLKGWRFLYLKELAVPSEIPVEINAFKSQQHRWSKGALQTAFRILPQVFKSDLSWKIKLEAFYHLTGNVAYLLMVILAFLMPLATLIRVQQGLYQVLLLDLPIFISATFSVCYFYWVSQKEQGRSTFEILRLLPAVLGLGIGVSLNNARGVLEALVGYQTPFVRTPKYGLAHRRERWSSRVYIRRSGALALLELAFGLWFTFAIWNIIVDPAYQLASLPFLLLFQFGFFYVGFVTLGQSLSRFWSSSR